MAPAGILQRTLDVRFTPDLNRVGAPPVVSPSERAFFEASMQRIGLSILGRGLLAIVLAGTALWESHPACAQPSDRIPVYDEPLFLSGGNVAWVQFARDIGGPSGPALDTFDDLFAAVRERGGNSLRLWLHTNGQHTPAWGPDSTVVGPGAGAIKDLRRILDRAERHKVGLVLCLWSFDMLRKREGWPTNRNEALLRDPARTQTYLENALVPMVEAVGDHPAVVAWEIFNEPEGMSERYGWEFTRHVPMSTIQRFVNRAAGAIHRADPDALVTNGSWSFRSQTDRSPAKTRRERPTPDTLAPERLDRIRRALSQKYRHDFSRAEARAAFDRLTRQAAPRNYYTDARLIEAGGDPDGTLDFYTVHYYKWAGSSLSPFHTDAAHWDLDKPLAVLEFALPDDTYGVSHTALYPTLYERGYAGAMGWSWADPGSTESGETHWDRALDNVARLARTHPEDVVVGDPAAVTPPAPDAFVLRPSVPNPVTDRATIVYEVGRQAHVTLNVFDVLGRRVATLVDEQKAPDRYVTHVDVRSLSSGVYVCRMRAGSVVKTRRMVVVK